MNDTSIKEKIINELNNMDLVQQKTLLEYILMLRKSHVNKGTKKNLSFFSGAINETDLKRMASVIAEGCEQVDENGW